MNTEVGCQAEGRLKLLDADGLALKRRLEEAYRGMLLRVGLQAGGIGPV